MNESNLSAPNAIATAEPILEYVKRRLNEVRGEWPRVAERTRLPYDTIAKIAQGKRPNPTLDSVQPIVDYFREFDAMVDRLRQPPEVRAA